MVDCNSVGVDPLAARSEARALGAHTEDRGFEFLLKAWMFVLVCVVLSCVGRGLATS
jgi:hypothetical protein